MPFLIGERTHASLHRPEDFSIRLVDRVAVKGKTTGVRLYEVLDASSPRDRELRERTRPVLHAAHAAYAERRFDEALRLLQEARTLDPDDRVLILLSERCARYHQSPPPDSWDGIEALTHK